MSDNKNYVPATLQPGLNQCRINSIELKDKPWKNKEGATITDVILNLESKPLSNFKGLKKNYNDPNSPLYDGQIGRVRISEFGFSDVNLPDFTKTREELILQALKSLFIETGQLDWFKEQDNKYNTGEIQRLIDAFNKEEPCKGFYMYYVLGSRQYINARGYKTDDLFLPKWTREGGSPFSTKLDSLLKFDLHKHVLPPKTKEVESFEPNTTAGTQTTVFNPEPVKSAVTNEKINVGTNTPNTDAMEKEWEAQAAKNRETPKVDQQYENFMNAGKQQPPLTQKPDTMGEEGTGIVAGKVDKLPWEE